MIVSFMIVLVVCVLHGYCLKLSVQARSPEAIFTWGICLSAALPILIIISLHGLGWMTRTSYERYISPLILPSIATIWFLPPLEWIIRVLKANKAKGA
jgi:hypothetical protein